MAGYSEVRRLKIVRWFGQPVLWCRVGVFTPTPLGEGWGAYHVAAGFSPQSRLYFGARWGLTPAPLGEGWGEGLVQACNNAPL